MHSDKDIPTIHSSWNWNTAQECLSKIVSIQTDKSTVEKMLQTLFSSLLRNKTFEKLVIHTELPNEYNFWFKNPNETFWVIFKQREFSGLSHCVWVQIEMSSPFPAFDLSPIQRGAIQAHYYSHSPLLKNNQVMRCCLYSETNRLNNNYICNRSETWRAVLKKVRLLADE